jgi:hypothetical protein
MARMQVSNKIISAMRLLIPITLMSFLFASCNKDNTSSNVPASTRISFKINGVYHELPGELTYNPLPVTGCSASYLPASNVQPSFLGIGYNKDQNQVLAIGLINASTTSGKYRIRYHSQYYGDFNIFDGGPYFLADTAAQGPDYFEIDYSITNSRMNGTFSGIVSDFNFTPYTLTEGKIVNVPFRQ